MPRIFDNIEKSLLPALQETLNVAARADFCVGYFNLRGWRHLADHVDRWAGGDGQCCRLLVGMHITPTDELRRGLRTQDDLDGLDNQTAIREKQRIAEEFRQQLIFGVPTNQDEAALRHLAAQIRSKKLVVKVHLRHQLHAKLYLLFRQDANNPVTGFLGSSNLTLAGLAKQGELNVDVLEHDACNKLVSWFEDRWSDRWCIDISKELAEIIEQSWAGEKLVSPYHVYLKMAYHLAQEARAGLSEFHIPSVFGNTLFDFQVAAVKIAAHHLNKRGGVLIGDVVGLGKSMMATALAKVFEDDYHTETLIICPKNLVSMWKDYVYRYRLHAEVMPLSIVINELPDKTRRYRVVLIDESHNLRNKEGKRYKVIREYIERNESRCILLSATPYNKTYLDLSAQLSLFLREDTDIGVRPEKLLSELGGEHEFIRRHQCPVRSLAAFEKSEDSDDWRDLMRLYMVRRTRGFIMQNYTHEDERGKYLQFSDGRKSYFPKRIPKNLSFTINDADPADPYARFYSDKVVGTINALVLPRYGLGNYIAPQPKHPPTPQQDKIIDGLSRAGTRLMGFCRTNLFKRLESAGPAFLLSIERHILRNFIVLHAIENGLDIPLGTQGAELLTDELRVLIATDVLSEGQNLQDAHIVVNYDLPWAIIRLIQRAGRVDRIGQQSDKILCYSFVPADGVERLIKLRAKVRQRLIENAEVVGSDETFFDDDKDNDLIRDLYTEKNGILDDDGDTEVDLASYAYQIWKNATDADPTLTAKIEAMPNVVYATKAHQPQPLAPKGVLVYMRTAHGNDALTWMDEGGNPVTQSQLTILKAAACNAQTIPLPRMENHHELTHKGLSHIIEEEKSFGGALGRPSGARFKAYERLKRYRESMGEKRDLFVTEEHVRRIDRALEEVYRYPLYQSATDTLNRQLKAGIGDHQLADLILNLREDARLCVIDEQENQPEPKLICSMGLA